MTGMAQVWLVVLLVLADNCHAQQGQDKRDIEMANSAIFWSLAAAGGQEGIHACQNNRLACSDDRGDLGLALIASKRGNYANKSLAELLRYQMDGALSESYNCRVLSRGVSMVKNLRAIDARRLAADCQAEFEKAKKGNQSLLSGVEPNAICATSGDISSEARALVLAISKKAPCTD